MLLTQVVDGYLIDARARKLSENTIKDYRNTYRRFIRVMGDVEIETVTVRQARQFMASLTNVCAKTARNMYIGLSALWTWAKADHIVKEHIWREIKPPRSDYRVIVPFTEMEVRALLKASVRVTAETHGKEVTYKPHCAQRNKSMVLFLVDTGLRATELCSLKISDVDMKNARVRVMGKGRKERLVEFSPVTMKALWRYLTSRPDRTNDDQLYVTDEGHPMGRDDLARVVKCIGKRAGVEDCHPHRFRHTFAVLSLKNGIDSYTLQNALGHSSMEMVRRYLNITQVDSARLQHKASPIANLGLPG